ncbi:MAG: ABC transporter substrate-binding protein [Burkholderiaceae bacterium]|jgi:branched-chain amino acid transport system substrate-binding protein|nr:ABC transporter substrate-binding protein [Burkholderiaceae bacterium]
MRLASFLLRTLLCAAALTPLAYAQPGGSQSGPLRIGVLTDMSGVYSDFSGNGSLVAVRMAIDDFGGKVLGRNIELLSADHQNKADIGANIAREWYDQQNVRAIFDTSNSAVTLAVTALTQDKDRIVMIGGSSTTRITGDSCTANSIQYVYDANALSNVTGKALIAQGLDTWYFITVDFAFGHGLEKATSEVVKEAGGKVLGSVRHPLNTTDFSSYLLQAQASGAKVIALANGGSDTINAIKGANEFGITTSGKQRVATLLTFITDVHAMGLQQAQGIVLTEAFYWDLNDATREWSRRFFEKTRRMPSMVQAGMYSATMHYLKAVAAAGTDDTAAVMKKMKATPVNDMFAKNGRIRADGLHLHDMYLMQVKKPSESKTPWDYYHVRATIPAEQAFSPMNPQTCKFAK